MRIGNKKFMRGAMEEERRRLLRVDAENVVLRAENVALRAAANELNDMLSVCMSTLRAIGYLPNLPVVIVPVH